MEAGSSQAAPASTNTAAEASHRAPAHLAARARVVFEELGTALPFRQFKDKGAMTAPPSGVPVWRDDYRGSISLPEGGNP